MSNAIFPVLPGLAWSVIKTPNWSTIIQKSVGGREIRTAYYSNPLWNIQLSYEVLRGYGSYTEFQRLLGFYNLRQGSFDSFLFSDSSDRTANNQFIATGNGVTQQFFFLHQIDTWLEPIGALDETGGVPKIFINGTQQNASNYSIDIYGGSITFNSPPANGATISWTGNFYYRTRFADDSTDFENFAKGYWTAQAINLVSVK